MISSRADLRGKDVWKKLPKITLTVAWMWEIKFVSNIGHTNFNEESYQSQ